MVPGLIEGHGHFMGVGYARMRLDLLSVSSYDELVDMVAGAVKKTEPGEWILGRGWHQSKWSPEPSPVVKGFQTQQKLSEISPDNPVWLTHASGHAGFANAEAMKLLELQLNPNLGLAVKSSKICKGIRPGYSMSVHKD